jgi:hypothetical protein
MPISQYFAGHGEEVLSSMRQTYKDPTKAKQVFYAKVNKLKKTPTPGSKLRRLKQARQTARDNA